MGIITPLLPPLILRGGEAEPGGVNLRGGGEAGGVNPKRGIIPPLGKGRLGGILQINVIIIMRPLIIISDFVILRLDRGIQFLCLDCPIKAGNDDKKSFYTTLSFL